MKYPNIVVAVLVCLVLLPVGCGSDAVSVITGDGDTDAEGDDEHQTEQEDEEEPEADALLCDPLDLDDGAFFGWGDAASGDTATIMSMSGWQTLGFTYNADDDALLITGYWINKLPLCACGYHIAGSEQPVAGDPEILTYIDENGMGQGSGILTVQLDLVTGASHVVARSTGEPNFIPHAPTNNSGLGFQLTVFRSSSQPSTQINLKATAGYDLRGCPATYPETTRSVLVIENTAITDRLSLCGQSGEGERDCSLPEPDAAGTDVIVKEPGAYFCDRDGCREEVTR